MTTARGPGGGGALPPAVATAVATLVAAGAARTAYAVLARRPPGGAPRWSRTNHAGRRVTLLEGPAVVVGCVTGAVAGAWRASPGPREADAGWGLLSVCTGGLAGGGAVLLAGAVGALDDLAGDATTRGLRGHLSALRQGRVTTGSLKIAGLAAAGATVALTRACSAQGPGLATGAGRLAAGAALAVDVGVVAGTANLVNLLDLRPGRALKVVVALALPLVASGSPTAGAAAGAALVALPADLAGERMLGDAGANALGAAVGAAVVDRLPIRARVVTLTLLVGLTLASERVSFTRVIESTPGLRELDSWGRRRSAVVGPGS
ncbi:hypothetical protein V3N99_18360 [Dermatophilaceae bacterium Soc4.6]